MHEERDKIHVIEADHYREERARLAEDPIIQEMARTMPSDWRLKCTHGGTNDDPNYHFMMESNRVYDERCREAGTPNLSHTIGAVARTLIIVRKQQTKEEGSNESEKGKF